MKRAEKRSEGVCCQDCQFAVVVETVRSLDGRHINNECSKHPDEHWWMLRELHICDEFRLKHD